VKLPGKLLQQSRPRLWLGASRDMMQRAQSYYGLMNALMMLITVYTVREVTIHKYLPWMNFVVFLSIIITVLLLILILDYKLVYPSQIAFHQHEAYKHRNLIRRDLDKEREIARERAELLDKRLSRIEEALGVKENAKDRESV